MGLDTTHGAFNGAYSAFNALRQEVARASGGSFPPHWARNQDGSIAHDRSGIPIRDSTLEEEMVYLPDKCGEGLREFLAHSDCDGEIDPEMCAKVADDLEALIMDVQDVDPGGHMSKYGGYRGAVRNFIKGCRKAHKSGESLEFF